MPSKWVIVPMVFPVKDQFKPYFKSFYKCSDIPNNLFGDYFYTKQGPLSENRLEGVLFGGTCQTCGLPKQDQEEQAQKPL